MESQENVTDASVQPFVRRSWLVSLLAFVGCGHQVAERVQPWPVKVKAKLKDGTPIEICVYDAPVRNDGFVINVHRSDDPVGRCWGTTIYPKPVD